MTFPICDEPFVPAGTEDDPMAALRVLRKRAQDGLDRAASDDLPWAERETAYSDAAVDVVDALNMALSILGLPLVEA